MTTNGETRAPSNRRGPFDGKRETWGSQPRVLVVSNVRLYREGLAATLAATGRLKVVGAVAGFELTRACLSHLGCEVVLLDLALKECLALPAELRADPPVKFVAFAVPEGDDEVLACAEAGISGYVGKDGSTEELVLTIEGALRGEVPCSPRIGGALFQRLAALADSRRPEMSISQLTHREFEIVELIDQGCSNKEIARRLRIGIATVKNHIHNTLEKLHVHRRAEAAAAIRRTSGARLHG